MVSDLLLPDNGAEPDPSYFSEEIAKIVAIEILFPFVLRKKRKEAVDAGTDTIFKLSEWLEMPEGLVELALSERYMTAVTAFRAREAD